MHKILFLGSLCFFPCMVANKSNSITLTTTNCLTIKGPVTEESTTDFIYNLNKMKNKNNIYVYLDTPGGSVEHGNKIVSEIQKYKLNCIADRAYSMGFVILQACKDRYILPHGSIMQHQISLGIMNEKGKIDSYMKYIDQIESEVVESQAMRVGLSPTEFRLKTMNEWWLYGTNAVTQNCADKVVHIECSRELTNSIYTENKHGYIYTYSRCPLVMEEIDKKKNNEEIEQMFYYM